MNGTPTPSTMPKEATIQEEGSDATINDKQLGETSSSKYLEDDVTFRMMRYQCRILLEAMNNIGVDTIPHLTTKAHGVFIEGR